MCFHVKIVKRGTKIFGGGWGLIIRLEVKKKKDQEAVFWTICKGTILDYRST